LTRVIKSRYYFSIKLQLVLAKGYIPKIINFFKKAFNVGTFEKHLVLLNLLMNIVFNVLSIHRNGGKGNGKRYHANTIKLFEVLKIFGGSPTHNFISKNLVVSTLNTISSSFCKEGFIYSIVMSESMFHYMCSILKKCKK